MTKKSIADKPLTRRQQEIYDFIADFINQYRFGPTIREIANAFMITSSSTVHGIVDKLVCKGYLTRTPNGSRTLALTDKSGKKIAMVSQAGVMGWIDQQMSELTGEPNDREEAVYQVLVELQEGIESGAIC